MRNLFLFLCASILLPSNTWNSINSTVPKPINIDLVSSDIDNTIIKFEMDGFHLIENFENSYIVRTENGASMLNEGNPDLHKISASVVIPDRSKMKINVLSSKYIDYKNINISPSKGNLSREINPNDVPFTYSDTYSKDEFYPSQISTFDESPYILRDLRGQAISFNPFQYNPITKVLRVYSEILIELIPNGLSDKNIINRNSMNISLPSEYNEIYASHFINYNNDQRFTYLIDQGDMLIISNSAFMETMQPLVEWKNKKGIRTEIVSTIETGSSSTQISSYIDDYYANMTVLNFDNLFSEIDCKISNESSKIQFWIDDSTGTPETMIAFSGPNGNGKIEIDQEHYPHALTKGEHFIRGMVESTEKGEKKWGYWKLDYKVE